MKAELCRKKRLVVIVLLLSGYVLQVLYGLLFYRWTRICDSILPTESKIKSNNKYGFDVMSETQSSNSTTELNQQSMVHTETDRKMVTTTAPVYSTKQAGLTPMQTTEARSRTTGIRPSLGVNNVTAKVVTTISNTDSKQQLVLSSGTKSQSSMTKPGLFGNISDIGVLPPDAVPVFMPGCSSNHFHEALAMFENFNSVVRKIIPSARAILYDLGLTTAEQEKIKSVCKCEYRQFPFQMFPGHAKLLTGYAFKPLAISMVLKEYPFALWMDASVRFKASNISQLIEDARRLDVICVDGGGSIARRTLPTMFAYFGEEPCAFKQLTEIQGGFIIARTTPFVVENILKPWVACALLIDCMVPEVSPNQYLYCNQHGDVYGECHRYDQSAWGILMYRAYGHGVVERRQTFGGKYVYL